jgi:hypothetical protein
MSTAVLDLCLDKGCSFDHGVVHSVTLLQVILSRMAMRDAHHQAPCRRQTSQVMGASGIHAYIWLRIEKVPHTRKGKILYHLLTVSASAKHFSSVAIGFSSTRIPG